MDGMEGMGFRTEAQPFSVANPTGTTDVEQDTQTIAFGIFGRGPEYGEAK